jgi:hypothetical protein
MGVIGHAMDGEKLLTLARNNSAYEFLQFLSAIRADQSLPTLNGKNDLNVNLGVCVSHWSWSYAAPTELDDFLIVRLL